MDRKRRSLLRTMALAGSAGLAGCFSRSSPGADPTESPGETGTSPTASPQSSETTDRVITTGSPATERRTTTETGRKETRTPTPATGYTLSTNYVRLQYGLAYLFESDSARVRSPGTPFLAASVDVDPPLSDGPERGEFVLETGADAYEPARVDHLLRTFLDDGGDRWYEGGRGLLLFELPKTGIEGDLRLTWPGGERAIDDAAAERIEAGSPAFSAALDLPDTRDSADEPPIAVEVTNEEERPARFVGTVARSGPLVASIPVARMTELVPPGETTTLTVGDTWSVDDLGELSEYDAVTVDDGEPDVGYLLSYASGGETVNTGAEIRLVE